VLLFTDGRLQLWRQGRSLVFLALMTVALYHDRPRPDLHSGRGIALIVGMVAAASAWIAMTVRLPAPRHQAAAVGACIASGLWVSAIVPDGAAPAYLIAAATIAVLSLPVITAVALTGAGALALAVVLAAHRTPLLTILIWVGALAMTQLLGVVRRQREEQTEQLKLLAQEQARTATLAERARLAREVHDVLAHSLAALSVQLETAAALLERDRTAEAAAVVDRAGRLARDGLTETRRAVSALRGDVLPLPELIEELTAGYRHDLDALTTFTINGEPRALGAEAGSALYRGAQEALTNVRKHAPGSTVTVVLTYTTDEVRLSVRNDGAAGPPVTTLSPGYGLTGLRERAELADGTVEAGPCGDGWHVDVRIPA
jgi:signal transduction histidine kinase